MPSASVIAPSQPFSSIGTADYHANDTVRDCGGVVPGLGRGVVRGLGRGVVRGLGVATRRAGAGIVLLILIGMPLFASGCGTTPERYESAEQGIAFEVPAGFSSDEPADSGSDSGMEFVAAWTSEDPVAISFAVMDTSEEKDPRSRAMTAIVDFVESAKAKGATVADADASLVCGHPVYSIEREETVAGAAGVCRDYVIAGKPYSYLLQVCAPSAQKASLKEIAASILATMDITGEAARWRIDPDLSRTYIDREVGFSIRYPDTFLCEEEQVAGGRTIGFTDGLDPAFLTKTSQSGLVMVRVFPLGRRCTQAQARRIVDLAVSSGQARRMARQQFPKGRIRGTRALSGSCFPGWTFQVRQKDPNGRPVELEVYDYVTAEYLLDVWVHKGTNPSQVESVLHSLARI